jgi:hypothetical protein
MAGEGERTIRRKGESLGTDFAAEASLVFGQTLRRMVTCGQEKVADLLVDVLAEAGVRRFAQWDHGLDSGKDM